MKLARPLVVALACAACSQNSHQAQLHAEDDVAVFCRAWESNGRSARSSDLAEYLASHLKGTELLDVFRTIPPEGDRQLFDKLHAIVRNARVTSCPTLDWMEKTYSVARPAAPAPASLVFAIPLHGDLTLSVHGKTPTAFRAADLDLLLRAEVTRDHATEVVVIAEPAVALQRVVDLLQSARSNAVTHAAIGLDVAHVHVLDNPRVQRSDDEMPEEVVIAIGVNGDISAGGTVMSDTALDNLLQATASRAPHTVVLVVARGTALIGSIVALLDRADRAGLTRSRIGLVASP